MLNQLLRQCPLGRLRMPYIYTPVETKASSRSYRRFARRLPFKQIPREIKADKGEDEESESSEPEGCEEDIDEDDVYEDENRNESTDETGKRRV